MDYSLQRHRAFIGAPVSDLPTPSLVVSLPLLKSNIEQLHRDVEAVGVGFRPHLKTLKTVEATRLMLANGKYHKAIVSTIAELRGVQPLVSEGILKEVIYGLPVSRSAIPQLRALRANLDVQLLVDHEAQLAFLKADVASGGGGQPWNVFIKLDVGSARAGAAIGSDRLERLVQQAESSSAVAVLGFYCHAGHAYGGRTRADAERVLHAEIQGVLGAARLLPSDRTVVLSVGATPTAHVIRSLQAAAPSNVQLELHAGNFLVNDLQQASTGVIGPEQQALRVCAEICSLYPERNEALINAGTIALTKEASAFPGFGQVATQPDWSVVRITQEHGILGWKPRPGSAAAEAAGQTPRIGDLFQVGDKVLLHPQHACITAAAFYVLYVVDEKDIVRDAWIPWKGW